MASWFILTLVTGDEPAEPPPVQIVTRLVTESPFPDSKGRISGHTHDNAREPNDYELGAWAMRRR